MVILDVINCLAGRAAAISKAVFTKRADLRLIRLVEKPQGGLFVKRLFKMNKNWRIHLIICVVMLLIGGLFIQKITQDLAKGLAKLDQWENKCRALGGTPVSERTFTHCLKPDSFIDIK